MHKIYSLENTYIYAETYTNENLQHNARLHRQYLHTKCSLYCFRINSVPMKLLLPRHFLLKCLSQAMNMSGVVFICQLDFGTIQCVIFFILFESFPYKNISP